MKSISLRLRKSESGQTVQKTGHIGFKKRQMETETLTPDANETGLVSTCSEQTISVPTISFNRYLVATGV